MSSLYSADERRLFSVTSLLSDCLIVATAGGKEAMCFSFCNGYRSLLTSDPVRRSIVARTESMLLDNTNRVAFPGTDLPT